MCEWLLTKLNIIFWRQYFHILLQSSDEIGKPVRTANPPQHLTAVSRLDRYSSSTLQQHTISIGSENPVRLSERRHFATINVF